MNQISEFFNRLIEVGRRPPTRTELKPEEFQCSICGGVFEKGWTEEEARAEEKELFGGNRADSAIVCDDCFKQMRGNMK